MSDETPAAAETPESAKNGSTAFMRVWADSLSEVLGQITSSKFPVNCSAEAPPDFSETQETDLVLLVTAAGGLRGEMSLRIPRASALRLAQLFVGEPPAEAEFKPEHQDAVVELLRQVAGHVCTSVKPLWGEVQLHIEAGPRPSWSAAASGWFLPAETASCQVPAEWHMSAALHAALLNAAPPELQTAAVNAAAESAAAAVLPSNLELLMDVELEVMLRFGSRNMLLQEVLDLGAGAVVELDRQVEEPAELLLDGRVIARGEVVVVDGNYGLRVTEVMLAQSAN